MNNQMNNGVGQVNQIQNQNFNNNVVPNVKKMSKSAKNDPKWTENWINVKKISNGIIYNNLGEMVTGIKIQPKNIFILDGSSMDNTLIGLMNFYNTIDYEFWLMVADRPVDINLYLSQLQLLYNSTSDVKKRQLIISDINKANMFVTNNVVDTEYYLLFKHKDTEIIQKRIKNLISYFANAGLMSKQTSNDDLRIILDNFLNGGQTTTLGTVMS